jgi:uncharacterized membrane protein
MADEACRFTEVIRARAPKELREAVERAASRELTTTSAYARRAIVNQLRADGFDPAVLSAIRAEARA